MSYREGPWFAYIMGSISGTLYVGMTGELEVRSIQHKEADEGFTANYEVDRLLYYETYDDPRRAISREKQLKRWTRAKKIALIRKFNPQWKDLSRQWYEEFAAAAQGVAGVLGEGSRESSEGVGMLRLGSRDALARDPRSA